MKQFFTSLAILPLFLIVATPALALEISNLSFDHGTGDYSFDYEGYEQGDITGESIEFKADNVQWQYNHQPASCTGGSSGSGSCSGTVNYDHSIGSFHCGTMRVAFYGYNPGMPVRSGLVNPDPDCSTITISSFAFNHSTGAYSFNYGNYTRGDISNESIEFKADNGQWQYNHQEASCTGGSSGSGSCSGTVNYDHSIGSFHCGTMRIGFYGYNPGTAALSGITNPDPSC